MQSRLKLHRAGLQGNETRTRMVLVDPLLAVLGWDTADPGVVIAEFAASGGGRADYALLGPDGKPAACIEAKKLDEPLQQQPHAKCLNY